MNKAGFQVPRYAKDVNDIILYQHNGDITQYDTQTIISSIHPSAPFLGAINEAIGNVSGSYHNQARKIGDKNLSTLLAVGSSQDHKGEFDNVLFVVDKLFTGLDEVVYSALTAADANQQSSLLIPALRTGGMFGIQEKSTAEIARNMGRGFKQYLREHPSPNIRALGINTYNDHKLNDTIFQEFIE